MALLYLDSSALVKLVRQESETPALRAFIGLADLVSSEISLAEVPRAIRRAAARDVTLHLPALLAQAGSVLEATALSPLDRTILTLAGGLEEPSLRALDAIHVAAAIQVSPIAAFVSYDQRQAAAARLAGLRTAAPGA